MMQITKRRVTGWLGILLGVLGTAAAAIAIGGVWVAGHWARGVTETTMMRVEESVNQVGTWGFWANSVLQGSKETVVGLREEVGGWSGIEPGERTAALERMQGAERRLTGALRRAEQLMASASAAGDAVRQLLQILVDVGALHGEEISGESFVAEADAARDRLRQALGGVDEIRQELARINEKVAAEKVDFVNLLANLQKTQALLGEVQAALIQFDQIAWKIKSRLNDLKFAVLRKIFTVELVLTGLLLWIAVAQISLIVVGRWLVVTGQPVK